MNLLEIPTTPPKPDAQIVAESMVANINASLAQRIHDHKLNYFLFWESMSSPEEILDQLGTNAAVVLGAASENVQHIARLASLIGRDLDEFLPPDCYTPRREITINQDGSASLAP